MPVPEIAISHPHFSDIAKNIPTLNCWWTHFTLLIWQTLRRPWFVYRYSVVTKRTRTFVGYQLWSILISNTTLHRSLDVVSCLWSTDCSIRLDLLLQWFWKESTYGKHVVLHNFQYMGRTSPYKFQEPWTRLINHLSELSDVHIYGQYSEHSFANFTKRLVHHSVMHSMLTGEVAYHQLFGPCGSEPVKSFFLGNAKLHHEVVLQSQEWNCVLLLWE